MPQSLVGSVRDLFLAKAVGDLETAPSSAAVAVPRVADSDEFFSFESDETVSTPDQSSINLECLQYLEDKNYSLDSLNKFPVVKKMLVKFNSAIPSSAPVEHLFSYTGMVLTKNEGP